MPCVINVYKCFSTWLPTFYSQRFEEPMAQLPVIALWFGNDATA